MIDELSLKFLDRLWNIANGITAFSVVQMLTFIYALQKLERLVANVEESPRITMAAIFVSGIVYSVIVLYCFFGERQILGNGDAPQNITRAVTIAGVGRLIVIW